MARYNQFGEVQYNRLDGEVQYNSFHQVVPSPFFTRLPRAKPIVLNQDRKQVAVLDKAKNVKLPQEVGGENVLTFSFPFIDQKKKYIQTENLIELTEDLYVIREVKKKRKSGKIVIEVYAESTWYDMQYADPLETSGWVDTTPNEPMRDIVSGTDWKVGNVEISTKRSLKVNARTTNRLKALRQIPELWGGELEFDTRNQVVNLVEQVGGDPGVALTYRKNIKQIQASYSTEDLITRLYPYGKNGMTIEDANNGVPYVENYQYTTKVRVRSFKDDRFTNPYHLKQWSVAALKQLSVPRASYSVKAADLSYLTSYSHEAFHLGDVVWVYDKELGVNLKTRIVSWEYNVSEPWNTELQLESTEPGLTDLLKNVAETTDFLQSEDTVSQEDMLSLMVFNYLLNSRADNGFAYWVNNGWEVDSENGYSTNASFKVNGEYGVEKTLIQTIYPSNRDSFTLSFRSSTQNLTKGNDGKIGVEVVIHYEDGSSETKFLPLA